MKKIIFFLIASYGISQTNCELCVEQNGLYCGDDESNWTQYSPLGCVPNGFNNLFYLNDGWDDCIDASDEGDAVPTMLADCQSYVEPCDTVYVDVPIIDTIYIDVINWFPEYIDCETMMPCDSINVDFDEYNIQDFLKQSVQDGKLYNLQGKIILKPKGIYIEHGILKYKFIK